MLIDGYMKSCVGGGVRAEGGCGSRAGRVRRRAPVRARRPAAYRHGVGCRCGCGSGAGADSGAPRGRVRALPRVPLPARRRVPVRELPPGLVRRELPPARVQRQARPLASPRARARLRARVRRPAADAPRCRARTRRGHVCHLRIGDELIHRRGHVLRVGGRRAVSRERRRRGHQHRRGVRSGRPAACWMAGPRLCIAGSPGACRPLIGIGSGGAGSAWATVGRPASERPTRRVRRAASWSMT